MGRLCKINSSYVEKCDSSCIICKHCDDCWLESSAIETSNNNKECDNVRSYNVGNSDYSKHKIQPWDIWQEYHLNPWDADIIKRVLRTKEGEDRKMDYEKIIHICKERINQLNDNYKF